MDLDSFSNAVSLVYEASTDVDRWSDVLATFCASFAARKGQISFATSLRDEDVVFRFHGGDERTQAMIASPPNRRDHRFPDLCDGVVLGQAEVDVRHVRQLVGDNDTIDDRGPLDRKGFGDRAA
jgi:hypothetical protein